MSILMECQAQEECISALPNQARDKSVGMPYQMKMKLSCPFHALAYEIECKETQGIISAGLAIACIPHMFYITPTCIF